MIPKILKKALDNLTKHKVQLKRDQWLQEAVLSEKEDYIVTCKTIVKQTINEGLEVDQFADEKEKKK